MAAFKPRNSLRPTTIKTGDLVGFRRLVRQGPGVLLPVFQGQDANDNKAMLYQVIGEDCRISAFIEDPDLAPINLYSPAEIRREGMSAQTGDFIIRAYETIDDNVVFAPHPEFCKRMENIPVERMVHAFPFVTLEIAHFINDRSLEVRCAKSCVISLAGVSHKLASAWLAGAPLSELARKCAEEILREILQGTPLDQLSAERRAHEDFTVFRDQGESWCPEMVALPSGNFNMGSPMEEPHDEGEVSSQAVTLSRRFAIGRYPVMFLEFDHFCEMTGYRRPIDRGKGRGRFPVTSVSWRDAQAYLTWLSEATRQEYRLPTEAEWEYACRSGTITPYSCGSRISITDANYHDSDKGCPSQVGQYPPNAWGLYDMHGNIYEWCDDDYRRYDASEAIDPIGPRGTTSRRAARGGSWYESAARLRSASRAFFSVDNHFVDLGFRCARYLE